MANSFWLKSGTFLKNAGGALVYDDHCCCVGCTDCTDGFPPGCTDGTYATCVAGAWSCGDASTPDCAKNKCTAYCSPTGHRVYQITMTGWSNDPMSTCTDCDTVFNATFIVHFVGVTGSASDCEFDSPGYTTHCSGILCHSNIHPTLLINTDGAGGLNITVGVADGFGVGCAVTFKFHQVGSTNCSGPWTCTLDPGCTAVCGGCDIALGSTATVVGL